MRFWKKFGTSTFTGDIRLFCKRSLNAISVAAGANWSLLIVSVITTVFSDITGAVVKRLAVTHPLVLG